VCTTQRAEGSSTRGPSSPRPTDHLSLLLRAGGRPPFLGKLFAKPDPFPSSCAHSFLSFPSPSVCFLSGSRAPWRRPTATAAPSPSTASTLIPSCAGSSLPVRSLVQSARVCLSCPAAALVLSCSWGPIIGSSRGRPTLTCATPSLYRAQLVGFTAMHALAHPPRALTIVARMPSLPGPMGTMPRSLFRGPNMTSSC